MNGFDIGSLYFDKRRDITSLQRQAGWAQSVRGGRLSPANRHRAEPGPRIGNQRIDRSSKLYKVCQDFESIFIKQMLNVMRKTVHKTGLVDGGLAEEIFEDMLYDEYALKMAQSSQFGISDMLYKELFRRNRVVGTNFGSKPPLNPPPGG